MIESVFSKMTKFYQVCFLTLMVVTLGSVLYFWKIGFIDGSRGEQLHQASFILESYGTKNKFNEVRTLIHDENPKAAISKIEEFKGELDSIHKQVEVEEFETLAKRIEQLKLSSIALIEFSKTDKILSVFASKMSSFSSFVKNNNWRTLTRMSQRVNSKVSGHQDKNKFMAVSKSILKDFESMIKITENSILTRKNKSEVVSRISNLEVEMNMLRKYATKRNDFNKAFRALTHSLEGWVEKVSPGVTLGKMEMERVGRYYIMGMLGILLLMSLMFFASFFYSKWYMRRASVTIENKLEKLISDGLLAGNRSVTEEYSENFQDYAQKISEYIDKRMSFGSIFKTALPLSSILLDQNLKVIWANQQFCHDWEISDEEIKKDYMSWDYLNKLTNIGSNDPVLEALKHHVAGIYQVQVKAHNQADVKQYEMFVSPVQHNNEKKIMLFFYDLTNLEDTITDQAKSILSPVKQSVAELRSGQFAANEQLAYEFELAGISDLYERFIEFNQEIVLEQREKSEELNQLYERINEYDVKSGQVHVRNLESLDNNKNNVAALKVFKDNVIGLTSLSESLEKTVERSHDLIYTNITALRNSCAKVQSLKQVTVEFTQALPRFENLKSEIKQTKSELYEARIKLSQELSQLSTIINKSKDSQTSEKFSYILGKIAKSFESLNAASDELDRKLANLEINMSKSQLIMDAGEHKMRAINSDFESEQVASLEQEVRGLEKMVATYGSTHDFETNLISSLQEIFNGTKSNLEINRFIEAQNIEPEVSHLNSPIT